jgi:hypothetical protein
MSGGGITGDDVALPKSIDRGCGTLEIVRLAATRVSGRGSVDEYHIAVAIVMTAAIVAAASFATNRPRLCSARSPAAEAAAETASGRM